MMEMSGAQALIRSLANNGVEVIFGLPGAQIMEAFDALYHEAGIRLVRVSHEQAATYMADGYARSTGKVGVALVVPGPGALNAASGLATAYATSSPVLLVSGQLSTTDLGQRHGALHEIEDQLDVFKPITKWNARVTRAEDVPHLVQLAMRQLTEGRPQPVEIEVPWDVLTTRADVELLEEVEPNHRYPDPALIEAAGELLAGAQRPLIWAGGGCRAAQIDGELAELAQLLRAPVITTPEGKGAIAADHPYALGCHYYGHGPAYWTLPQADVILALGSRLQFVPPVPWGIQPHQKTIQVDADPAALGRNYPNVLGITADARLALNGLVKALGRVATISQWTPEEFTTIRQQTCAELHRMAAPQVSVIGTIRRELDDDAILVSGNTEIGYWSHLAFPVRRPRSYLTAGYFVSLGYAFPTALGAKLGNPHRQVVAISGDGGFVYCASELATAVREGINVVTLVFNNGALGASRADQEYRYGGRIIGTDLNNPDFVALARAYGALGIRLSSRGQLRDALHTALLAERPTVIEVPIPNLRPPFQIPPHGLEAM